MTEDLANKSCRPCEGGVPPLTREQSESLMKALHADWQMSEDGKSLVREYGFPAYSRTLAFANTVAWIATNEGHHPVMEIHYGSCKVSWTTNAIDGLSDNDFICAAKLDRCSGLVMSE